MKPPIDTDTPTKSENDQTAVEGRKAPACSRSSDVKPMGAVTISRNGYIEELENKAKIYRQALINLMEAEDRYGHGASMCHPRITIARAKARQFLSENVKGMARRGGAKLDQTASSESPSTPCYPLREPSTAPRDGTVILGAFGWPWLLQAVWCELAEEWATPTVQAEKRDGVECRDWEIGTEKHSSLTGWMPMPELSGEYLLSLDNAIALAPPTLDSDLPRDVPSG